jgi:hypothetical protein
VHENDPVIFYQSHHLLGMSFLLVYILYRLLGFKIDLFQGDHFGRYGSFSPGRYGLRCFIINDLVLPLINIKHFLVQPFFLVLRKTFFLSMFVIGFSVANLILLAKIEIFEKVNPAFKLMTFVLVTIVY